MLPFLSLSTQHIKCQPTHVTPNDQFEEMARFGRAKMKRGDEDWHQRKRASMNKVVVEAEEVNNKITHYARNDDVDGLLYTLNTANKTLEALTIALKRDDTFTHAKRVLQVLKRNTTQLACAQMNYCDLAQFSYKTKTLRIDRIRYDVDVFGLIYKLLAPVAAKAADMRALGTAPEDAHIEPIDPHDVKELREELEDTMKTHVERIM